MKKVITLALVALTVVLAGCTTTKVAYSETQKPDASFHYRNPHYSYLVEPQALDNGYAREITPANLEASLQEYNVTNRCLAKISIYWNVSVEETHQIIDTWVPLLKQHQFDRIVFIRENGDAKDTTLVYDTQRFNNPPLTAGTEPWMPMRAGNPFVSGL